MIFDRVKSCMELPKRQFHATFFGFEKGERKKLVCTPNRHLLIRGTVEFEVKGEGPPDLGIKIPDYRKKTSRI